MEKIKALYRKCKELCVKYKAIVLYLIFGAGTTVINLVSYYALYHLLGVANVPSTILAWLFSVLFAFVTNRIFVFEQKENTLRRWARDFVSFVGCRVATGVLDVIIMYLAVDKMQWNSMLWKIVSNVIVTILNYVASKYLVFTKKKT